MLSNTIEQVYNAFFYSISTHLLHQQSDEILFGHFMTILNATFESKIGLEDEGYDSGSEHFNIPTPLKRTSKIYHASSVENAPTPSHAMQYSYQGVTLQTGTQMLNFKFFWGR